jgi:hypothetical protein
MKRSRLAALGSVLVVATFGRAVAQENFRNPYLRAGLQLFADLEYEAAVEQFRKARDASGNSLEEDVAIDLYEGTAQAELRHDAAAEYAFKLALSLKPDAQLPARVSPKVRAIFERVKGELSKVKSPSVPPSAPPSTDVPLVAAPSVPPPPPLATVTVQPPATEEPPPTVESRSSPWLAPGVTLGVGAVLAIGGGTLGILAQNGRNSASGAHFQSDAVQQANTAYTEATAANVAYGAAGIAAIVAVVLLVVGLRSDPAH